MDLKRTLLACAGTAVIAGGATATASTLITGAQIKDNTITGHDVKNGTLGASDIRKGSILLNRLSVGTQRLLKTVNGASEAPIPLGTRGPQGTKGDTGAQGPKGDTGPQGPKGDSGTTIVTHAGDGFSGSNPSVVFTPAGVTFGPYADNSSGGSLVYDGVRGLRLRDLAELSYSASYTHAGGTPDNGDAPYLRVFIDNNGDGFTGAADDHDVVFSPSTQPGACAGAGGGSTSDQCNTSGRLIRYDVQDGTVRYDDDPANGPDSTWDAVLNAHGDDVVDVVRVTSGFSLPGTQSALLNSLRIEVAGRTPKEFSFSG